MKKSISAILISVILVTFAFGTAFAKEEYRIKFGYSASDKEANIITFYNTFEKYVEEASGGRIAVDVYANAQLGGERQMLEGMTLGTIEMAMLSPGIAANIAPKFQVIDLPYLFNDRAAAYKALDGKLGQTLNDQILPKGVRLLCFPENGFRQITNNNAPIKSPADLKGVKVRVQPIPAHLELFKAFGANPTPVDFGELYTALLQTVDAQENSITLIYSSKLYEVQKYLTMSNHVYAPSAVFMSEAFYKRLPADLQKIVMDGAKKFRDASRANQQKEGDRLLKEMVEKNGLKVYSPTDAEMKQFRDAAQSVYKTMEPVLGKELIDMAREANKK